MKKARIRWRFFWSRRSRTRIALTGLLLALTTLAMAWLALPPAWRLQAQSGFATFAHWINTLDTRTVLFALIGLCLVEGLALLLTPSYRKHGYLATAPRLIPPVSVYLDAENQLSKSNIKAFMEYLVRYLDGRRADLLFFLDASQTATSAQYKTLYRSGFRPVDVPHNPTGKGAMREAVDREIAMHAFERALLGPANQEFIIVSRDGDYVPLIYRLVALGHRVQVWALRPASAYDVVANYLGVNVINLADALAESRSEAPEKASTAETPASPPPENRRKRRLNAAKRATLRPPFIPQGHQAAPVALAAPGEGKLYYAIAETLDAFQWSIASAKTGEERNGLFHGALGNELRPRLSSVGYGGGSWSDYWLEHLVALHIFKVATGQSFPERDVAPVENAAHALYIAAYAAANAVLVAIASMNQGDAAHMREVAEALVSDQVASDPVAAPLLNLVRTTSGTKRWAHTRYLVRSARALGLLSFEDIPGKLDEIGHPHLPDTPPDGDQREPAGDASGAIGRDDSGTDDTAEPMTLPSTSESPAMDEPAGVSEGATGAD